MTLDCFAKLVQDQIELLPEEVKMALGDLCIDVEDACQFSPGIDPKLVLGNYWHRRVILFREPFEQYAGGVEIGQQIQRVLRHEISHSLGCNEKYARELESC